MAVALRGRDAESDLTDVQMIDTASAHVPQHAHLQPPKTQGFP
jgi:hypothetical protein